MPRKKTDRKKQQGKKEYERNVEPTENDATGTTVNVFNCHNVQIGNSNVLTTTDRPDSGHTGQQTSTTKDQKNSTSREELGVLFLKEIIWNSLQPITLEEFEKSVTAKLSTEGPKNFRELSGWCLNDFTIKYKDVFEIFRKKQTKLIRLKKKHKIKIDQTQNITGYTGDETDVETSTDVHDSSCVEEHSGEDSDDDGDIDQWTTVQKKGTKAKLRKQNKKSEEARLNKLRSLANFEEGTFDMLLRKGTCEDILHVLDIDSYLNDPFLFSLDIVSMWNTPHRIKSYIIIGLTSDDNVGITTPLDDLFWQNHFREEYFTRKPLFICKTAFHKGSLYGVIEVESSHGSGTPCAVKQTYKAADNVQLEKGVVWFRKSNGNIGVEITDTEITPVLQWCLGTNLLGNRDQTTNRNSRRCSTVDDVKFETKSREGTFAYFWKAVQGFKKGHFILLAGDISNMTTQLEALALPPWVAIYDFDIFSNTDGLLNILQGKLEKNRNLKLRTWKEPTESISEHGTLWYFMRGRSEIPDSRTDLRDGSIEDTSVWMKMVKSNLYSNCETLVRFTEDYTVLTIVLLWPKTEKLLPFMLKTLDRMYEDLSCAPNIVICTNTQSQSTFSKTRLQILQDEISTNLYVCDIPYEDLFEGLKKNMYKNINKDTKFTLPVISTDYMSTPITETDAAWMRDDFEVLYLDSPYARSAEDEGALEEEIEEFYKGGNLHWFAWYECSKRSEDIVIERSKLNVLKQKILPHLQEYKTTVITLFHAPGSGGTTLAQSILWKLHTKVPCVHMKLRTGSSTDEILKKVSFLYEKTGLAVVVLIDGEEESKVRYLSRRLKYSIILYVKRYPYAIQSGDTNNKVLISGVVTPDEATKLASKFAEKHEGKKTAMKKLRDDVCKNGIHHFLFEFGMTVHLHEFKGIVSYVKGYLGLDKRKNMFDLSPAQQCLGYLSLVYYYGQTSVPCQFFASLFGKPSNYNMALEDFPHPIQEFVVFDKNESKQNNIRICHYFVAKEILQQILVCSTRQSKIREEGLSLDACRNLKRICENFIEYASKKRTRNLAISPKIRLVLTKTFIFRDEKDISENEEQARRKPVLSKLMNDIPSGKPLFTERLEILQKLSSSFPNDPNFCAHLGRFYAYCRSDEKEAEQCFKKAIQLCDKMCMGKESDEMDEGIKLSLMHIYHMYGMVKQRYVSRYIKQSNAAVSSKDDHLFYKCLNEIVPVAEDACDLFRQSRDITPDTHQVYLFAYTGEIQVRLQVCEFIIHYFAQKNETGTIPAFLNSDAHHESKYFVQNSILVIERLILECYTDVDLFGDDITSLQQKITWFNSLFQRKIISVTSEPSSDSISHRRLRIAEKKLKYGTSSALTSIENINDENDIEEIVRMYEENFDDVEMHGLQSDYGKTDLERDFRDWILGIRNENFKKNYSVEQVLSYVEKWYRTVPSPLATFYKFVLNSLLGFGTEAVPGNSECLQSALVIQEQLEKLSHLVIRPKYPREWLGLSEVGIKQLVPGKRHVGICSDNSNDITLQFSDLLICKGTIMYPNTHSLSGRINYNTGLQSVRVFFIPKVVGLQGKRYVNKRVEFVLGFSLELGYEAYHVKLLRCYGCSKCNANLECTSTENDLLCKCGNRVYRDDLCQVTDL